MSGWKILQQARHATRNSPRNPAKCKGCDDWFEFLNLFGRCDRCGLPPHPTP
ncbi:putative amidophosphoribosyltransferase [Kibdelosporangium banguiense]|uniref:Amidophosphoribosyltransferase n=1 Tax=Kibdelosporangium banguiense TaxID=1365924 RepID=A0ABS4TDA8_9PSEU|nr:putative amidophosphoribosyltransferase [Kibdelosporangium banguiense]